MSKRLKTARRDPRARRARRPSGPDAGPGPFLMTFVAGPPEEPCDCPICRIMGIDLTAVDGMDVRSMTPEQAAQLEAYLADERGNQGC